MQLPVPLHTISHDDASRHSTWLPHAPSPQVTRHGMFGGHATTFGQLPGALQSISQMPLLQVPFVQPSSHKLEASGVVTRASSPAAASPRGASTVLHCPATGGAAQNPSAPQICPPPQSLSAAHVTVQSRSVGE